MSPLEYRLAKYRLVVALEAAGQEVLLEYLKGEAIPQNKNEFKRGEDLFGAASSLLPGDPSIESRRLFCRGRSLLFDAQEFSNSNHPQDATRTYTVALDDLQRSIRLNPRGAYSYNALGIAYLQMADFAHAVNAFNDALTFAPNWAYARHNLALAQTQAGQYEQAIQTYRAAIALRLGYAYLPYNLGLLSLRLNRIQEARSEWRDALSIAPDMARAWNALALSYASQGDVKSAQALSLAVDRTDRLTIRHDQALLFVKIGEPGSAIPLWRANLNEKADDIPSLIGLSHAFVDSGQLYSASEALSSLIRAKPDYLGAHLEYAQVLIKIGSTSEARVQLQGVLGASPNLPEALEMLADLDVQAPITTSRTSSSDAASLYERALEHALSSEQRKRISRKLRNLRDTGQHI
jgi:tetratricopeptide (TPR) repeat protein